MASALTGSVSAGPFSGLEEPEAQNLMVCHTLFADGHGLK